MVYRAVVVILLISLAISFSCHMYMVYKYNSTHSTFRPNLLFYFFIILLNLKSKDASLLFHSSI